MNNIKYFPIPSTKLEKKQGCQHPLVAKHKCIMDGQTENVNYNRADLKFSNINPMALWTDRQS